MEKERKQKAEIFHPPRNVWGPRKWGGILSPRVNFSDRQVFQQVDSGARVEIFYLSGKRLPRSNRV